VWRLCRAMDCEREDVTSGALMFFGLVLGPLELPELLLLLLCTASDCGAVMFAYLDRDVN